MIKVVGVLWLNKKQAIASWFFVARSTITTRFKHRSSFLLSILRKHILKWGLPKKVIHSSSWTSEVCDPKDTRHYIRIIRYNHNYHMNMKARGCIEKFKVYLNKDKHELEHETFLQQMWKWVKMALDFCKCQNYHMHVNTQVGTELKRLSWWIWRFWMFWWTWWIFQTLWI